MTTITKDHLLRKIKVLNETIWEHKASEQQIKDWLKNFEMIDDSAGTEQNMLGALYLLSQFSYYGNREMRALLKVLYRDLYKYPIIEKIRKRNHDTLDNQLINTSFLEEQNSTRFLSIGNPSESSAHLLYYFRQENALSKDLFINGHNVFASETSSERKTLRIRSSSIRHYVFLDDFCGSGDQAIENSEEIVKPLKEEAARTDTSINVAYYSLFATSQGISRVRSESDYDKIQSVFELDDTYKCFGKCSRYFARGYENIDKDSIHYMCRIYGSGLNAQHPLGYKDGQLLIGFSHNTPDNTLPIFWYNEPVRPDWAPMFRRYSKTQNKGKQK